MRRFRWVSALGLLVVGCEAPGPEPAPTEGVASAPAVRAPAGGLKHGATASVEAPTLALLRTEPGRGRTELVFQPADAPEPRPASARLRHLADGEVRAALLPGTRTVVAVADMERRGDGSWGAWLLRLQAGRPAVSLVDRVFHASRPLVTGDGRVLVQRGLAGDEPTSAQIARGELRTDRLTIDEVDVTTGTATTLHAYQGYVTHLAGALGDELFVYRVAHRHADLIAIRRSDGTARTLAPSLPAFARDFSVDAPRAALVYANRDELGWMVERMDTTTGARTVVARAGGIWVAPHVLPDGSVLLNDGAGSTTLGASLGRPLEAGFAEVRGLSEEGRWAAVAHRPALGARAAPMVLDLSSGEARTLAVPAGMRAEIVGVAP